MPHSAPSCRSIVSFLLGITLLTAGCDQTIGNGNRVEAVLRVSRRQADSQQDHLIYCETQASLLKSNFVLNAALRSLNTQNIEGVTVEWLSNSLEVELAGQSELIYVRLPIEARKPQAAEAILDSVIEAYQNEILNKERLEKVETLSKLRKRYAVLFDSIKDKTDEVRKLVEQIGAVDVDEIESSYRAKKLGLVHRRLLDRQLREIALRQREEDEKLDVVRQQIKFLREQAKELEELLRGSAELETWMDELLALRRDAASLRQMMVELEVELEEPGRVTTVQPATVTK